MYRTITVAIVHSIYSQSVHEPACGAGSWTTTLGGTACMSVRGGGDDKIQGWAAFAISSDVIFSLSHFSTDSSGRTSAASDITLIAGLHDRSSPDSSRVYHYVSNVIRHGSYTGVSKTAI